MWPQRTMETTSAFTVTGVEIGNSFTAGSMTTTGFANAHIGSAGGTGEFFNGKIDDLRMWSVARDTTQLKNGMNQCASIDTTGLLLWLGMNDGTGATVTDQAQYNLNATLLEGTTIHSAPNGEWEFGILEKVTNTQTVTHFNPSNIIYVDSSAVNGYNSGDCWQNAFLHLYDALATAKPNDTIWIAKGTYYPDEGVGQTDNDRDHTFPITDSIVVYGGFVGNETLATQRDWVNNRVILSGNIQQDADSSNNTYTVVTGSNLSNQTVLDGVRVTDGFYNKNVVQGTAGIYLANSNATIRNAIVCNNRIHREGLDVFSETGAGMFIGGGTSTTLNNVTICNNHSYQTNITNFNVSTGGILNYGASPILKNVTIKNNSSSVYGPANRIASAGGLLNYLAGTPTLHNVTIANNSAICSDTVNNTVTYAAGGILTYFKYHNPIVINSNIRNNWAYAINNVAACFAAGGILHHHGQVSGNDTISMATNTIISNNFAATKSGSNSGFKAGGDIKHKSRQFCTHQFDRKQQLCERYFCNRKCSRGNIKL